MKLSGSCHCGAINFSVVSKTYVPYMQCYCSICRKTTGAGGYAINLMADADTLRISDPKDARRIYQAVIDGKTSSAERSFCSLCGSHLWLWDPRWPELVHPLAAAIDTPLPKPPESVHIMLDFKPDWVDVPDVPHQNCYSQYPELSIKDWHKSKGLYEGD
ncbi:GFA family protein [Roseibium sp. RKSG952]|uniref:GFA family protein n=1 Tax=Roseibium sp. RKSG952 TaxID=2529384 RepID=UPI0012BC054B|nr:GFA family protein [Roseibium sp. RKSG952]MTH96673.1 GFA family protein [Roseibium sp. RKSG952]